MTKEMTLRVKRKWHYLKYLLNVALYGRLKTNIKLIGVTGTDGKTTTSHFIYSILKRSGRKAGMICTIGVYFGDTKLETGSHTTTPTYGQIKKYLKKMEKAGVEYAVLEATSHGLFQYRLHGLHFIAGVLTNITGEHQDYFYDIENIVRAKEILFEASDIALVNADDPNSASLTHKNLVKYGLHGTPEYLATDISSDENGSLFKVGEREVRIKLYGQYNVYNALAAFAACDRVGVSSEDILNGLWDLEGVQGRLEEVPLENAPFKVIVDFAHTSNALDGLLSASRKRWANSKLIIVFGSAGLRDRVKRPLMGEVTSRICDKVILTAEDPRTEKVEDIANEILSGVSPENRSKCEIVPDRYFAIKRALEAGGRGDVIFVTGKGCEDSMCFGTTETPWSDIEAIKKAWGEIQRK